MRGSEGGERENDQCDLFDQGQGDTKFGSKRLKQCEPGTD